MRILSHTIIWKIPENEDATSMIIAFCLNIGICHKEDRKDDYNNIPSRENEPGRKNIAIYT
jgi:hypothetical protein